MNWDSLKRALGERPLPAALVDLDTLERNVAHVRKLAEGKPVRIASKSVRHLGLLRRIAEQLGSKAIMSYSAREAAFLVREGFDDILLAYPTGRVSDGELLAEANRKARVAVAVDHPAHLSLLAAAAEKAGTTIPLVIDVDVSLRVVGAHVGVRRSPLHSDDDVLWLAERILSTRGLSYAGLLTYEAQIAGLTDQNPFSMALNAAKYAVKLASRVSLETQRQRLARVLTAHGFEPKLFNGGGSGNLPWCSHEPWLTEVTAGSAFLNGHLFDYYRDVRFEPSLYFALQVARIPGPGFFTCHGGGYVASGEAGQDRLPRPVLPDGLSLLPLEGAGEVQTPLRGDVHLSIGDPVFFRHAKSGELAEHFPNYLLVRGDKVVAEEPTYRGLGHAFL
jgi:D-serine deaminase-like pyridoxal phosphate-dependent protein